MLEQSFFEQLCALPKLIARCNGQDFHFFEPRDIELLVAASKEIPFQYENVFYASLTVLSSHIEHLLQKNITFIDHLRDNKMSIFSSEQVNNFSLLQPQLQSLHNQLSTCLAEEKAFVPQTTNGFASFFNSNAELIEPATQQTPINLKRQYAADASEPGRQNKRAR